MVRFSLVPPNILHSLFFFISDLIQHQAQRPCVLNSQDSQWHFLYLDTNLLRSCAHFSMNYPILGFILLCLRGISLTVPPLLKYSSYHECVLRQPREKEIERDREGGGDGDVFLNVLSRCYQFVQGLLQITLQLFLSHEHLRSGQISLFESPSHFVTGKLTFVQVRRSLSVSAYFPSELPLPSSVSPVPSTVLSLSAFMLVSPQFTLPSSQSHH